MKQKLPIILSISVILLGILFFGGLLVTRVKKDYSVEVGENISVEVFRQYTWDKGKFEWVEIPDTTMVGTIQGKVYVFPITYDVTLHIIDTKKPIVSVQKVDGYYKCEVSPEQFILSIEDSSDCEVNFKEVPNNEQYGLQEVHLVVKDSAGNETEVTSQLYIMNLKEQVTINLGEELPEASEFLAQAGSEISYITDINKIDKNQIGNYEISFLVDGREASSWLKIADMEAPTMMVNDMIGWKSKSLDVSVFVTSVIDNSENIQVRYETEPDWELVGEQEVTIIAEDESGRSPVQRDQGCFLRQPHRRVR